MSPYASSRSVQKESDVFDSLEDEGFIGSENFFFAMHGETFYTSITKFFGRLFADKEISVVPDREFWLIHDSQAKDRQKISFITDDEIDTIAVNFLLQISNVKMIVRGATNLDEIVHFLAEKHGFGFQFDKTLGSTVGGQSILGKIQFNPNLISISSELEVDSPRWRFTLAHEIGHLVLHRQILDLGDSSERLDVSSTIDLSLFYDDKKSSALEVQANKFAAAVLLPRDSFLGAFIELANLYQMTPKGFGYIYLDQQFPNIADFLKVVAPLGSTFKTSREVVKIRLKRFRLLSESLKKPSRIVSREERLGPGAL